MSEHLDTIRVVAGDVGRIGFMSTANRITAAAEHMEALEREVATFEDRKAAMQRACAELQMALEVEHGKLVDARSLLERMVDPDPCCLDHHGFCQTHLSYPPCTNAEAKKLLGDQ